MFTQQQSLENADAAVLPQGFHRAVLCEWDSINVGHIPAHTYTRKGRARLKLLSDFMSSCGAVMVGLRISLLHIVSGCVTSQHTSRRSRVSAMNLVVESEACLRSATTDTIVSFSCLLLLRQRDPTIGTSRTPSRIRMCHNKRFHVLMQIQEVINELHHFSLAEFGGEFGLAIHWENDQRAAVLIKSTCTSNTRFEWQIHIFN